MPPRSLALLPPLAALALAVPLGAQAVMCLKPGSLGPDVPNCAPYQEGSAKAAVSDNLLALAGQAAAEQFNERLAIDEAGPLTPQRVAAAKARASLDAPSRTAAQVTAAPGTLGDPALGTAGGDYDRIAGQIVTGTGNAFQTLEAGAKAPAALTPGARGAAPSPAAAASGYASFAAPAAGPAGQAPARAGGSRGMAQGEAVSIGSLDEADPGRSAFDNSSAGPAVGGGGAKPRTVRDCSPLHPCSNAD